MAASGAEPAGDGEAVHVRQHHVEDGEVWIVSFRCGEGVASVGGGDNIESREPQGSGEQFPDIRLVIDYKQFGFRY
ncbi:hypothetical protein GCM10009784_28840 [Arthrobacter parietis]|uniref:Uncharacterized protein n=1 Tax=Arthrobacter parietis TaxID=271434 RepID=A0ABN3B0J5_9MICC